MENLVNGNDGNKIEDSDKHRRFDLLHSLLLVFFTQRWIHRHSATFQNYYRYYLRLVLD